MPDTEPPTPEVVTLRGKLESVGDQEWESAATRPELGSLDFKLALPILAGAKALILAIRKIDLSTLPTARIVHITQCLDAVIGTVNAIRGFNIAQDNAKNVRDRINTQLRDTYNNLLDGAAPALA